MCRIIFLLLVCIIMCTNKVYAKDIRLAFVGDISSQDVRVSLDLEEMLSQEDILLFGNLETVVSSTELKGSKCLENSKNCFAFIVDESITKRLKDLGFDFLSTANNHMLDFGQEGLTTTYSSLDRNKLLYSGFGKGYSSYIHEYNKICFTAFSTNKGYNNIIDVQESAQFIFRLKNKEKCDFLVVSFHGGCEGKNYAHVPNKEEFCYNENRGDVKKFSYAAIDNGADIVFGHGPHVLRPTEKYKEKYIFYSLGNFSVNSRTRTDGSLGQSLIIQGTLQSNLNFNLLSSIPIEIVNGITKIKK